MNKASTKAYVSKRKLERYREEREKRLKRIEEGLPEEEEDYKSGSDGEQQKRKKSLEPQEEHK